MVLFDKVNKIKASQTHFWRFYWVVWCNGTKTIHHCLAFSHSNKYYRGGQSCRKWTYFKISVAKSKVFESRAKKVYFHRCDEMEESYLHCHWHRNSSFQILSPVEIICPQFKKARKRSQFAYCISVLRLQTLKWRFYL